MLDEIRAEDVREFLAEQRTEIDLNVGHPTKPATRGLLSPNSVLGRYSSISVLFHWADREGLLRVNPVANVKRPRIPHKVLPVFSQDEIRRLLAACEELPENSRLRDRAIVLFLLDTGVRCRELLDLMLADVKLEENRALVMGKGAKQRYVFFGKITRQALWRYVSLGRAEPMPGVEVVLLNQDGTPLQERRMRFMLDRLGEIAEVPDVHPHKFRHTAAVQFLRNGGNVFVLQKMLGHTTLEMVRRYVELSQEDLAAAHKSASPADRWGLSG
jgi:site-specific recombinase XerD